MKKRKSLDAVSTQKIRLDDEDAPPADNDNEDVGTELHPEAEDNYFDHHLRYDLKEEEINELNELKLKYTWKMPASGMPKSHWKGTGKNPLKDVRSDEMYGGQPKLYKHWQTIKGIPKSAADFDMFNQFFLLCSSYRDILHGNKKPFYQQGRDEDSSFMDAYIMHALNHVYHTRELVTKNDSKHAKHKRSMPDVNLEIISGDNFRDQGFTQPKVMLLLPFASIAYRVVKRLIQLTPLRKTHKVEEIDRFNKEFGSVDFDDEDGDEKTDRSSESQKPAKPKYEMLLGDTNDHFMVGIKFTKRSLKLYSDFYSSDIIVASPLALIAKIVNAGINKKKDVDYLSSIELLIIDHADVIAMQNWSHLKTAVEQMNHRPSKQQGTHIMRIRPLYLNGHAQYYRQTILLGSFLNPDMCGLFNQLCRNYEGKVILKTKHEGVLSQLLVKVPLVCQRFNVSAITDADDARFDYFCEKVYPWIKDSTEGGILLFISSYLDCLRVKDFLQDQEASYCEITEYSDQGVIERSRDSFHEGKLKIMLYTEKAYFYHRYKIHGIKNIIFYSLPERKEFFPEITSMLKVSIGNICRILYSSFDILSLEKIIGTDLAKNMLSANKGQFVYKW